MNAVWRGKSGIGTRLLILAIVKTVELSAHVGISGVVLDALTDDLLTYYRRARFERLPYPDKRVRRMLLTMRNMQAQAKAAGTDRMTTDQIQGVIADVRKLRRARRR